MEGVLPFDVAGPWWLLPMWCACVGGWTSDISADDPAGALNRSFMSDSTTYTVAGMTCGSCATTVTEAVNDLDGVIRLDVDLTTGTLTVTGEVEQDQVRAAVTAAGYRVSTAA